MNQSFGVFHALSVVGMMLGLAVLFGLGRASWECSVEIERGPTVTTVHATGPFFSSTRQEVTRDEPIEVESFGTGMHQMRFSESVAGVSIWIGGVKLYEKSLPTAFAPGDGRFSMQIHANGAAKVLVTSTCYLWAH